MCHCLTSLHFIFIMNTNQFLSFYDTLRERRLDEFEVFFEFVKIFASYSQQKNRKEDDLGFNLFTIISENYYHRENLHSDVMKALLDPQGSHGEGLMLLEVFLSMLHPECGVVDVRNYGNARVIREEGRIDVLIKDEVSRHCVIVENKINYAVDQERQLPSYYHFMKDNGYNIDAIVYLPPDEYKLPDTSTWTKKDKDLISVDTNLCIIPTFDNQKKRVNLLDNWLTPCKDRCENEDCRFVITQYIRLLEYLKKDNMDRTLVKQFADGLRDPLRLETLHSIIDILEDLKEYKIEELYNQVRSEGIITAPVQLSISGVRLNIAPLIVGKVEIHIAIDSLGVEGGYFVQLWDNISYYSSTKKDINIKEWLVTNIPNWRKLDKYPSVFEKKHESCLQWSFKYEEEDGMYKFVISVIKELNKLISE